MVLTPCPPTGQFGGVLVVKIIRIRSDPGHPVASRIIRLSLITAGRRHRRRADRSGGEKEREKSTATPTHANIHETTPGRIKPSLRPTPTSQSRRRRRPNDRPVSLLSLSPLLLLLSPLLHGVRVTCTRGTSRRRHPPTIPRGVHDTFVSPAKRDCKKYPARACAGTPGPRKSPGRRVFDPGPALSTRVRGP